MSERLLSVSQEWVAHYQGNREQAAAEILTLLVQVALQLVSIFHFLDLQLITPLAKDLQIYIRGH